MKMIKQYNQGFTLIEVLVAVLVFSFGLLGIAGMMTISVKSNHNGYLRSQANFLAENMVDRMRANPVACLLYTSPSPRDRTRSRMPSSA